MANAMDDKINTTSSCSSYTWCTFDLYQYHVLKSNVLVCWNKRSTIYVTLSILTSQYLSEIISGIQGYTVCKKYSNIMSQLLLADDSTIISTAESNMVGSDNQMVAASSAVVDPIPTTVAAADNSTSETLIVELPKFHRLSIKEEAADQIKLRLSKCTDTRYLIIDALDAFHEATTLIKKSMRSYQLNFYLTAYPMCIE
jgi:hypothetical protein